MQENYAIGARVDAIFLIYLISKSNMAERRIRNWEETI
jgi:hypothetical protein